MRALETPTEWPSLVFFLPFPLSQFLPRSPSFVRVVRASYLSRKSREELFVPITHAHTRSTLHTPCPDVCLPDMSIYSLRDIFHSLTGSLFLVLSSRFRCCLFACCCSAPRTPRYANEGRATPSRPQTTVVRSERTRTERRRCRSSGGCPAGFHRTAIRPSYTSATNRLHPSRSRPFSLLLSPSRARDDPARLFRLSIPLSFSRISSQCAYVRIAGSMIHRRRRCCSARSVTTPIFVDRLASVARLPVIGQGR